MMFFCQRTVEKKNEHKTGVAQFLILYTAVIGCPHTAHWHLVKMFATPMQPMLRSAPIPFSSPLRIDLVSELEVLFILFRKPWCIAFDDLQCTVLFIAYHGGKGILHEFVPQWSCFILANPIIGKLCESIERTRVEQH